MTQKPKTDVEVISNLLRVLTPDVRYLLNAEGQIAAQKAIDDATTYLRRNGNCEGTDVHKGFVEISTERVEVEFIVPGEATAAERDSYFLANLAAKIKIGHVQTQSIGL